MTMCFVIDTPGGTRQLYDRVVELVQDSGTFPPEGHVFQAAGPVEGAWRVVDVWQSQELFDRFMSERLGPALEKASAPPPAVSAFPVHGQIGAAPAAGETR